MATQLRHLQNDVDENTGESARSGKAPANDFFESMADAIVARIDRKWALRKRVFTLEEAAEYLGLTPKALQQKVARGEITPVHMDRLLRFDVLDLDRHIERSKRRAEEAA